MAIKEGVEQATLCLANSAASILGNYAVQYATGQRLLGEDPLKQTAECFVEVATTCGCGGGGAGGGGAKSFVAGTLVLTPEGLRPIEALREGDLVVARDEETGVSGVFPITALMSRAAPEVIWLTLAGGERIGVTSEHPLFVADEGWTRAEEVVAGDALRTATLAEVEVVGVETDRTAQRVYNLEIGDAATYFVGDTEVWGHNAHPFGGPGLGSSGVGPFAGACVPFSLFPNINPNGNYIGAMQEAVNVIGSKFGCHTCGTFDPKTPSGNWVGDHQVPKKQGTPKALYPHCLPCSCRQGPLVKKGQ